MALADQVDLAHIELPNALEFTVTRERGWIYTFLTPAVALAVLVTIWRTGKFPLQIMAVVAGVSCAITLVANWIHGKETKMRVTAEEIVVRGNLNSWFQEELRIDARELSSLKWDCGGDGDECGLYARWGWSSRCLLAGITRDQAEGIREAIARKFPEMTIAMGDGSGLITLGLSGKDPNASKTRQ